MYNNNNNNNNNNKMSSNMRSVPDPIDVVLCCCLYIQLKALDSDSGLNGQVKYSLSDDVSASLLYIDERTGVLRLSRPLDRETTSQIQFTVWATDSGDDPKSASAEVYMHLC